VHELPVELRDELRVLQDDLGHERAGLEVPAALELEEVALGADHRALGQPLAQSCFYSNHGCDILTTWL
jgi:hypothetical protein